MGLMRYGKAVQRLQIIAERWQRVSGLWDEAPPLTGAYAFGEILDRPEQLDVVQFELSGTGRRMLESRPQARMRAIRTAGPQLRRIFDSSRAPGSDVADRLPGSSRTMTSPVRKTPGFGRWPGDRGSTGTRS